MNHENRSYIVVDREKYLVDTVTARTAQAQDSTSLRKAYCIVFDENTKEAYSFDEADKTLAADGTTNGPNK